MKSKKLASFIIFFLVASFTFSPILALGQSNNPPAIPSGLGADGKLKNPIGANDIIELIKIILEGIIKIGIPLIALAIIYSGFLFVFARGNPGKITEAKDALLYSLVGAVLLLGAWTLAKLISDTVLAL